MLYRQIDFLTAAKYHVDRLVVVLHERADTVKNRRCLVCNLASVKNEAHFVIPVAYIASCLASNSLAALLADLPLRTAFLCQEHSDTFDALLLDPADLRWDVERLERRAEVLGGVMSGSLLIFGGKKVLRVVQEFHAAIVALKEAR